MVVADRLLQPEGNQFSVRRLVRERCDFLLCLPMRGQVTSLNVAVAGSIVLYEARRQQALRVKE